MHAKNLAYPFYYYIYTLLAEDYKVESPLPLKKIIINAFLAISAIILTILMIIYPQATFDGAKNGLNTWLNVLIPSLLPFLIISNLLVELGVVKFLGILLEPLMRPLFNQPGAAGFVVAMGFTSGFPMGAVLTNTLYEKKLVNREEAARLVAFTNNSSPLFLLIAIPIGMFHNPRIGMILLIAHYLANILLGILLGLTALPRKQVKSLLEKKSILDKSIAELIKLPKEIKPIGNILGSSVKKGIETILLIGGFVIFFSVLIEVLKMSGFFKILIQFFSVFISYGKFTQGLGEAIATGFFEMTLGAQKTAEINAPIIEQLMIVSLILGWSGLSIQAQVSSIVAKNNIPIIFYLVGRVFQGFIALILTVFFFKYYPNFLPVFQMQGVLNKPLGILDYHLISFTLTAGVIGILLLFSLIITLLKKLFP